MAVNKNFVVKNGLEVSTDLILADAARNKVGIGSTTPRTELDVRGGIAATDANISGVGTIVTLQSNTGTVTNLSSTNLIAGVGTIGTVQATHITASGIVTAGSLNIGATQVISSGRQLQNIVSLDATTTATIESAISNAPNTFTDLTVTGFSTLSSVSATNITLAGIATGLNVPGISTLGSVQSTTLNVTGVSTLGTLRVSSGIVTATSGIITYYGDGRYLQNVISGVGIGSTGGVVGYGVTFINFYGPGVSTAYYSSTTGIATVYFQGGGGGGASVSIGTAAPVSPTSGDLWYNNEIGRTFIYYDEVFLGIGSSKVWVDAAPFNIGVLNPVSIALSTGTFSSPSLYFSSDSDTGLFQPTPNQQTFVAAGASVLNVNPGGINVTGVVTATSFRGDGSNLTNLPAGLGTALSSDQTSPLNKIYYTDQVLSIGSTVTVDPPSTAKVAYTQYAEIQVESGADLIIADGDDFIPNILGIGTTGTVGTIGGGGRVRADNFSNRSGTGAPTFNAGLNVTGVVTATEFDISGSSNTLTTSGLVVNNINSTGVATFATANITQSNPTNLNVSGITTLTGLVSVGSTIRVKGFAETQSTASVASNILNLDASQGTVFTHTTTANIGIVSFSGIRTDTASIQTFSVLVTQGSTPFSTTTATGIGTQLASIRITPGNVGYSTHIKVGGGSSITLTNSTGALDLLTFIVSYNGATSIANTSFTVVGFAATDFRNAII